MLGVAWGWRANVHSWPHGANLGCLYPPTCSSVGVLENTLVCFTGNNTKLEEHQQAYKDGIEKLLSNGFFYSDELDLSMSLQAKAQNN